MQISKNQRSNILNIVYTLFGGSLASLVGLTATFSPPLIVIMGGIGAALPLIVQLISNFNLRRRFKILVVEDNPLQLEQLATGLEIFFGSDQIVRAKNASEARALVKSDKDIKFGLIDDQLRDSNCMGTDLIQDLVQKQYNPELKFILCTGYALSIDIQSKLDLVSIIDGYLNDPNIVDVILKQLYLYKENQDSNGANDELQLNFKDSMFRRIYKKIELLINAGEIK